MLPSVGSRRPAISFTNVVLPQPLRPTNAIMRPAARSSVMLLKILGASGPPYLKQTLRNSILPSRLCTGVNRERSRPCSGSCSKISLRRFIKKAANTEMTIDDLVRADPQKNRGREQADGLQHAVVRHNHEIGAENLFRDGKKLVQHRIAEDRLGRGSFDCFDPFDGINLMRTIFSLALLNLGEKWSQNFEREIHETGIERHGGKEGQREPGAIERHQHH